MTMTPEAFITDILKEKLHAEYVVCGFNYRFGHKAAGDPQLLKEFGAGLGINTVVHDEVKLDGETVSSTAVRKMIEDGDMEKAARFLGRPYSVSGKVVGGRKIGRKIGFPTVNLPVPMQLVTPPNGVYFTMVYCNGREYPGVTDIGVKPTVRKGGTKKFVETHILDFDGKLYGNEIRVDFLKMRRPEVKFSDIEALKRQIKEDRNAAAEFHKNGK